MDDTIKTIVIVGGGTAGWMAAAALSRFLPTGWTVRLVESDAIGTVGVGEATIPQLRLFNAHLGIDEDEFVRATQGTFKLGIEFAGWSSPKSNGASRYTHAFGTIGRGMGLVPFHHYWLRGAVGAGDLWDYSPTAIAARENRFARDLGRPELPNGVAWAFQFDAALYAAFLRRYAEARRVERIEGKVVHVAVEAGNIASVTLEGDREITGDLFIDCSGFRGLLIEEALHAGYQDWTHLLPCDRALAVPSANVGALTPYTRATAKEAGWQWRIPLQHRCGNGIVYSSAHLSDDRAAEILLAGLDGAPLADPRPLRFRSGRRKRAWVGNCIALGLAAGFMEPLESTSIHLVQSGIARLLQLLPAGASPASAAEFNRQTAREWEAIRDFLVFHYHANGRDEPFWRACREATIPDSLAARIALFRESGRIVHESHELFTEVAWLQVMTGQGIRPESYHPLADDLSATELAEYLSIARRHAKGVAERMPTHDAFIAAHAAAAPTTVAA